MEAGDAAIADQDGLLRDMGDGGGCSGPGCGPVAQVAAGARHTCVLLEDNTVWCWGDGERGQLGDGQKTSSVARVQVKLADPTLKVAQLASGAEHSCVLLTTGDVYCWGDDSGVQASGSNGSPDTSRPVQVPGLPVDSTATRIALGYRHSCALTGTYVWCWGDNDYGQQGRTAIGMVYGPHVVPNLVGASGVACGHNHCCAHVGDTVHCWGDNGHGQIGTATTSQVTAIPTAVAGVGSVDKVRCGGDFCCVIHNDNTVSCWGDNGVAQLGDAPSTSYHPDPHLVSSLDSVEDLALGYGHSCALAKGKALCWGYNRYGQLGIGEVDDAVTPTAIAGLPTLGDVAAGSYHTCVVGLQGELWCWGHNVQGQVGNGEASRDPTPAPIPNLAPSDFAAGGLHSCALQSSTISCWGYGMDGQLGDGLYHNSAKPTPIQGSTQWKSVGRGGLHSCAVDTSGHVYCWGANWISQCGPGGSGVVDAPRLVDSALVVDEVVAAHDHTCTRGQSGVHCWGSNASGQLGVPAVDGASATPQKVAVPAALALDARGGTTCMVDTNKSVVCWGSNDLGQLGNNTTDDSSTPVKVQLALQATGVAVGGHHACAVADGKVWCWGNNTSGQLGVSPATPPWRSLTPVQAALPGGVTADQVTAGWGHTCARTTAGAVYCWGENGSRQLGRSGPEASGTPALVQKLPAAASVHAGWDYTCALVDAANGTQTAYCWGSWFHGQLGDGRRSRTWSPVRIN